MSLGAVDGTLFDAECQNGATSKIKNQKDDKILLKPEEIKEEYEGDVIAPDRKRLWKKCPKIKECPNLPKRYLTALLTSFGFLIIFGFRSNLSVFIVQMFNPTIENETTQEFYWTSETISIIESSFYWGYFFGQVPGGLLAAKYPANRVFGSVIAVSAFLNMLIPQSAKVHPMSLVFIRFLQGMLEGATYPACHGIWRHWAPLMERTQLITISFCGAYAGLIIGMHLSTFLTDFINWEASFYFYGCAGLVWYCIWLWLSFEKPACHPTIGMKERQYIEKSLGNIKESPLTLRNTPWKAMFMSLPVYAIIVANICHSWTTNLLFLSQYIYLYEVFRFDVTKVVEFQALPYILLTVVIPIGGIVADFLRRRKLLTTTSVRKLFNCGGFLMEFILLLVVGSTRRTHNAFSALTLAVVFNGLANSGFNVNHLDIAPRYASILMGISGTFGTLSSLICPMVVESLTKTKSYGEWKNVFHVSIFILFIGIAFYAIFASGEKQTWAEPVKEGSPSNSCDNRQSAVIETSMSKNQCTD